VWWEGMRRWEGDRERRIGENEEKMLEVKLEGL
jgi:hypothetical protein